jgi:hypothetical protein
MPATVDGKGEHQLRQTRTGTTCASRIVPAGRQKVSSQRPTTFTLTTATEKTAIHVSVRAHSTRVATFSVFERHRIQLRTDAPEEDFIPVGSTRHNKSAQLKRKTRSLVPKTDLRM